MLRRALTSRQTLLRHRVLSTRTETDSFGPLEVPSDKYYGAQTALDSDADFLVSYKR